MAKRDNVSMSVIRRLPRYYRFLSDIERGGRFRISSAELAGMMGLTASQIRQDLNCFGEFGQQGYGYDVSKLKQEIAALLGINKKHTAVMVGGGNLGRAVAIYLKGNNRGFNIQAIFEKNHELVGQPVEGINVLDISTLGAYCRANSPEAAFLCIPSQAAESVVEDLYSAGVRYFWNFSHCDIIMRFPDAVVENVHLSDSLMTLSYQITRDSGIDKQL